MKKIIVAIIFVFILVNFCAAYNSPQLTGKKYCYFGLATPALTVRGLRTSVVYVEGEFLFKEKPVYYQLASYHLLYDLTSGIPSFTFLPSATKLKLYLKLPWLANERLSMCRFIGTTITLSSSNSVSLDSGFVFGLNHPFWSRFYLPATISLYPDGYILDLQLGVKGGITLWGMESDVGVKRNFISLFNGSRSAGDFFIYFGLGSKL